MEAPDTTDRHRGLITAPSDGQRWIRLTIAEHGIRPIAIVHPAGASSDGADHAWKIPTIAIRSSRDRTPSAAESPLLDPTKIDGDLGPRSKPDRGPIVADRGAKIVEMGTKSTLEFGQNHRESGAASSPSGTAPTTRANRLHDRSNDP